MRRNRNDSPRSSTGSPWSSSWDNRVPSLWQKTNGGCRVFSNHRLRFRLPPSNWWAVACREHCPIPACVRPQRQLGPRQQLEPWRPAVASDRDTVAGQTLWCKLTGRFCERHHPELDRLRGPSNNSARRHCDPTDTAARRLPHRASPAARLCQCVACSINSSISSKVWTSMTNFWANLVSCGQYLGFFRLKFFKNVRFRHKFVKIMVLTGQIWS